jgi:hypothetical protein
MRWGLLAKPPRIDDDAGARCKIASTSLIEGRRSAAGEGFE